MVLCVPSVAVSILPVSLTPPKNTIQNFRKKARKKQREKYGIQGGNKKGKHEIKQ